jgi:hypothetical protein
MTKLSPAAQAVLDAANGKSSYGPDDCLNESCWIAAAALRAAADQFNSVEAMPGAPFCRNKLLAIANELENING